MLKLTNNKNEIIAIGNRSIDLKSYVTENVRWVRNPYSNILECLISLAYKGKKWSAVWKRIYNISEL